MPVQVRCTEKADDLILVNGKEVRRDIDGDWKHDPKTPLTMIEAKFCGEFLGTLQRCRNGKKFRAVYTV